MICAKPMHLNLVNHLATANVTTRNDNAWIFAADKLLKKLDLDAMRAGLDVLCLVAPAEADALRNIVNPGTYDATNVNGANFSYNAGPGTDWGFDISATGPKYVDSNYHHGDGQSDDNDNFGFAYARVAPGGINGAYYGAEQGFLRIWTSRATVDPYYVYINQWTNTGISVNSGISPAPPGFAGVSRASSSVAHYAFDVGYGTASRTPYTSASLPWANSYHIGRNNNDSTTTSDWDFDGAQIAAWGFGRNMFGTASGLWAFRNHIQTFMADIGADV